MRTTCVWIALALFGPLCVGCQRSASNNDGKGNPAAESKDGAKKPLGVADFKVSVREFVADYRKDAVAARDKYKGKTVEVTGVVDAIGTESGNQAVVLLEVERNKPGLLSCAMAERYPAKRVAPRQTATVKGRVDPEALAENLVGVEIVKVEGPVPPAVTAESLAAEFAKDQAAAGTKYVDKFVALSGAIEKVEMNDANNATVTLKAPAKGPSVVILFTGDRRNTFKAGQTIELIGEVKPRGDAGRDVGLFGAELTAAPK